jgi:hypothetical protein
MPIYADGARHDDRLVHAYAVARTPSCRPPLFSFRDVCLLTSECTHALFVDSGDVCVVCFRHIFFAAPFPLGAVIARAPPPDTCLMLLPRHAMAMTPSAVPRPSAPYIAAMKRRCYQA